MSRCFPFPPPGYELKIKADDTNSQIKEKHRERKPKREKKYKEKKESKYKSEKERTDEKRREKKDKKEKHRDKKEERNLDKGKHKGNGLFPDEKRAVGPPDVVRENGGSVTLGEKRVSGLPAFNNGTPISKNNLMASQTKIITNSHGLGKKNTDEEKRTDNQLPDKKVFTERKRDAMVKITANGSIPIVDGVGKELANKKPAVAENVDALCVTGEAKFRGIVLGPDVVGTGKSLGKSAGTLVGGRESKDKRAFAEMMDERISSKEVRYNGTALPPRVVGTVENRVGAMVRPVEKTLEHKLEKKDKIRKQENDNMNGEIRKEVTRKNLFFKEAKNEEKVKATSEQKHVHMPRKIDGSENHMRKRSSNNESKMELLGRLSDRSESMSKPISQKGATLLGKRKDIELNGVYDERMTELNKLARTTAYPLLLTENGSSLERCQNSAEFAARPPMNIKVERTFAPGDAQRPPMNIKVDGKDRKVNGINTVTTKKERKNNVTAKKAPHPDTKYLNQILSLPKLDEFPEFDDQEWMFSSNSFQTRNPLAETSEVEKEQKAWTTALWLEVVDVFALPYVVPL